MAYIFQSEAKTLNRSGHLYHYKSGLSHGEIRISNEARSGLIPRFQRLFGAACVSFTLALMLYSYAPTSYVPLEIPQTLDVVSAHDNDAPVTLSNSVTDETHAFGINSEFSLAIPQILAYSNIIENVSPFDQQLYTEALQRGVAHAEGTGLPGENKRMFVFAHSTNNILNFERYNAIFYELRKLSSGDNVYIYYKGEKFTYEVFDKKTVAANDISWLAPTEEPVVILQTCDPPGTTWKRLLVFARLLQS